MEVVNIVLFLLCIFIIILIIVGYIYLTRTLKGQGMQIKLLVEKEKFRKNKEGYCVIPSALAEIASSRNGQPNQLLPTHLQQSYIDGAAPPIRGATTDPRGNHPMKWLRSGGKAIGANSTIATTVDTTSAATTEELTNDEPPIQPDLTGAGNPIDEAIDTTPPTEAIVSATQITAEDVAKSGAGALSDLSYNENLVPEATGPVITQNGLAPETKEGFSGCPSYPNQRICPMSLTGFNAKYMVPKGISQNNISQHGKEGFKPSRTRV